MKKISADVYECPAFVDTHSHDDLALLSDPTRADKKKQGIGVQVIGNCGISPFPALPESCRPVQRLFDAVMGPSDGAAFSSLADYRRLIHRDDIAILQGYNTLRASYFGSDPRPLGEAEGKQMADAVRRAVEEGAVGLSLGLAYLPAIGANREELVKVARQTPLITVHLRNEASGVLKSIDEVVDVAETAGCRLHISHVKISGKSYWKNSDRLISKLRAAHEKIGATFDHYPYTYGSTALAAILPPEIAAMNTAEMAELKAEDFEHRYQDTDWENYVDMCGWDKLILAALEKYPEYNLRSIEEVRRQEGEAAAHLVLRLVREEPHPAMLIHSQSDDILNELLKLPFGCVGTDGLPPVRAHPRLTSTFPEYLRRCRAIGMTVEAVVEKASVLPRQIFGIAPDTGGTVRFNWSTGAIGAAPPGPDIEGNRKRAR